MRRLVLPAAVLLLAFPVVVLGSPAVAAGPPTGVRLLLAPGETGKYYVVGPPVNGRREYLFAIAAKTLGDGNRYQEIFALNSGRRQPDGQTMTEPTRVEPGWVLALPKDAKGPGVVTGPLPTPGASTPAAPASAPPVSMPPDWAGEPSAPADASADDGSSGIAALWSPSGLRIALLVLAVLLVAWAQLARVARRRSARAVALAEPVSSPPPPTPPTPTPPPALTPTPSPATASVTPTPTPIKIPAQREAAATPPPVAAPDLFAALETELTCGDSTAEVRLIGTRPAHRDSSYGWLENDRPPPPTATAVVAGVRDGRRLWIDLAMAPDALTVRGDVDAARAHTRTLLAQLGEQTDVVVAGDALGDDLPARWRRVDQVDQLASETPRAIRVLVCAKADVPHVWQLLCASAPGPHRTVPVVVGPAAAARWSINLGAPA